MTKEQKSPEDIAHKIVSKWDEKNFSVNYIPLLTLIDLADKIAIVIKSERSKALTTKELWPSEDDCLKARRHIAAPALRDMISRGQAISMMFDYECWLKERIGKRE